jgi:cytochrome c-type biogenesis protein CcmH/NrfG
LVAAVGAARERVQKHPGDAEAWFQLGLGWQRTGTAGSADSAAAAYAKALEIEPENVEALVHHGLVLEDLQRFEDAMGEYTKAANLAPEDPLPYINLGSILYFHYRRTYEAKEALTKAIELDPQNADAHFNLGVLFADANMFSEAKAEWEAARGFAPEGSPARALAEDNLARIRELTDSPASN